MSRAEALAALITKVETGENLGALAFQPLCSPGRIADSTSYAAHRAYHGSLDAAVAFVEEMLPGWVIYRLNFWPDSEAPSQVEIWETGPEPGRPGQWHDGAKHRRAEAIAEHPARALLLAALRALAAQEDEG